MYKYKLIWIITACLALTSCATASFSKYKGVGRIKRYEIYSEQVPDSFNGFRIAFASDFHYESRFDAKRLHGAIVPCKRQMQMSSYWEETIADGKEEIWKNCSRHWHR